LLIKRDVPYRCGVWDTGLNPTPHWRRIEAVPDGSRHKVTDDLGAQSIDIDLNHHPVAQVLKSQLLHDEAAIHNALTLTID